MGGQQSLIINGNGNHKEDTKSNSNSNDNANTCQPCFLFPFLPPSFLSRFQTSPRLVSAVSDPIGTPLPETPVQERRKREFMQQAMREEADKQTQLFSSRYGGLEKEVSSSSFFISPVGGASSSNNGNGKGGQSPEETMIHEGPGCEDRMHEKYQLLEVLGVGSTSMVHRCVNKVTDEHYACKVIDCEQMEDRFSGMMAQFQTEVQALKSLRHPAIIRLYDVFLTETKIFIVMELMEGGELFDYVVQKGTLTEEEASKIVRKCTSAVAYMHAQNFIHRDLKPENLLLKRTPKGPYDDIDVKIIDFGLSKIMEEPVARTFLGTRGYLSPEQLSRRDYTKAVDSWALGVIVFVLLCGCLPFDDDAACIPSDELVKIKFQLRYPRWAKNLSPSAKDLLSHLLNVDPLKRYTAEEALDHPWVRGVTAPKENVLASPKQMKKSPIVCSYGSTSAATKAAVVARHSGQQRRGPIEAKFSPPTPQGTMMRKTSI